MKTAGKSRSKLVAYHAAGQYLRLLTDAEVKVEGGGTVSDDLVYTAPTETKGEAVFLNASSGELKSVARARVIPSFPWRFDFEEKKVPLHWVGAAYRHQPIELPTGGNGLVKISTIPKGVRSQAFFGKPNVSDYTVQAEVYALDTKNKVPTTKLPDMGVVAQRARAKQHHISNSHKTYNPSAQPRALPKPSQPHSTEHTHATQ